MPGLESVYDSDEEINSVSDEVAEDWFSDVGYNCDTLCDVEHMYNQ